MIGRQAIAAQALGDGGRRTLAAEFRQPSIARVPARRILRAAAAVALEVPPSDPPLRPAD